MEIVLRPGRPGAVRADLLVVSAASGSDPTLADLDKRARGQLAPFLRRRGFKGSGGATLLYQSPAKTLAAEYLLVVPRHEDAMRNARALADAAIARAREVRARTVAIVVPHATTVEALAETLELAAYQFHGFKSAKGRRSSSVVRVLLTGAGGQGAQTALDRGRVQARAACLARELVNLPADVVTPSYLASTATRLARQHRLSVRVLNERQIRRLGMGALLGVARGSIQPPRFIELIHRPRGATQSIALVGKGITFDSGGLSLKSGESMMTQKKDMAGAAVVLGVMSAVRDLGVKVEVRGYIPTTENMPSGAAIKPGDVVRACNGKTIEVLNTDAEGRLVLADGLSFAARGKPHVMIDFATLTGAVRPALGHRYAAILASDPALARALIDSAGAAGESLWEMPLVEEYRHDIDSTVADLKNIGEGHSGTIIGGLFLREFTAGIAWAHIDFSSTAVTEKAFPGHPRGASGFGVRTTLQYLRHL